MGLKSGFLLKLFLLFIGRIVIDGNFCFNLVKMVVLHDVSLLGTSGFLYEIDYLI